MLVKVVLSISITLANFQFLKIQPSSIIQLHYKVELFIFTVTLMAWISLNAQLLFHHRNLLTTRLDLKEVQLNGTIMSL